MLKHRKRLFQPGEQCAKHPFPIQNKQHPTPSPLTGLRNLCTDPKMFNVVTWVKLLGVSAQTFYPNPRGDNHRGNGEGNFN